MNETIGQLTCMINSMKEHIVILKKLNKDYLYAEIYLEILEKELEIEIDNN